jgi:hypothetical protein
MNRIPLRLAVAQLKDGTMTLRLSETWRFFVVLPGGSLP